jgi:hypothetical protein
MRIKAKLGMWIGVGLVTLFALLGVNTAGNNLERASALSEEQTLATGENLNESDSGTWLAEYESDGVRGAGGVSARDLAARNIVLLALLLILTGAMAAGTEIRQAKQMERRSDE